MSADEKWAAGPWYVIWPLAVGLGMSRPGIDAGDQTIIEAGAEDDDCGVFGYVPQEVDANARLIASAPELYEALAIHLKWFESHHAILLELGNPDFVAVRDMARAALKKARGEV